MENQSQQDGRFEQIWNTLSSMASLTKSDQQFILEQFKPVSFRKKDRIIDTEETSTGYVFINQGLARLYGYKDGEEKTLFFFKEGMFAGSIQTYLFEKPSVLVVEAMEDIEGLAIDKQGLDDMFAHSKELSQALMIYTQHRLNGLLYYFSSFVLDSPEERYEKFILSEPDLFNRVPQHVIASFLGITPVSLSRIRKRLMDKG